LEVLEASTYAPPLFALALAFSVGASSAVSFTFVFPSFTVSLPLSYTGAAFTAPG